MPSSGVNATTTRSSPSRPFALDTDSRVHPSPRQVASQDQRDAEDAEVQDTDDSLSSDSEMPASDSCFDMEEDDDETSSRMDLDASAVSDTSEQVIFVAERMAHSRDGCE